MPVEIFLGGLASLTLAAILIVVLTSTRRESFPESRGTKKDSASKRKRSDR